MNLTNFIMDLPFPQIGFEIGAWLDIWDNFYLSWRKSGRAFRTPEYVPGNGREEAKTPSTRPFAGAPLTNPLVRPRA
jgi:hypothetical protein